MLAGYGDDDDDDDDEEESGGGGGGNLNPTSSSGFTDTSHTNDAAKPATNKTALPFWSMGASKPSPLALNRMR